MPPVRLGVERVPAPPGTPADMFDRCDEALARERTLLDIRADGYRILAPRLSAEDAARAKRQRLWAERGDFAALRADTLRTTPDKCSNEGDATADPLSALLALVRAPHSAAAVSHSDTTSAPPERRGTITESEFFPMRDSIMHQLEVALFGAEQAQNLLGMLIQNARAQNTESSTVLAAQAEYFLEPQALGMSSLAAEPPDDEIAPAPPPLSQHKLILHEKFASLRRAGDILARGAADVRHCVAPERARWDALRHVQRRGWKLTPGRPLVDMERFDVGAAGPKLQGFGMPVLHGDGTVNDEGARDAWIGYGPSEAPIALLQRTLAYWADAQPDGQSAALAFPDRSWRRLRVSFCEHADGVVQRVWSSASPAPPASDDLDAQLYGAQLDAVDVELFGEIAAQSGVLSPVLARTVSDTCVTLPLSSTLDVRFTLVKDDDDEESSESPLATILLQVIRLRMLRGWTQRIATLRAKRASSIAAPAPALRGPLMAPLWDIYQYTLVRLPLSRADTVPRALARCAGSRRGRQRRGTLLAALRNDRRCRPVGHGAGRCCERRHTRRDGLRRHRSGHGRTHVRAAPDAR